MRSDILCFRRDRQSHGANGRRGKAQMQVAPSQTLFQVISHLGSGSRPAAAPARQVDAAGQSGRHNGPAAQTGGVVQQTGPLKEAGPDAPIRRGMLVDIRV